MKVNEMVREVIENKVLEETTGAFEDILLRVRNYYQDWKKPYASLQVWRTAIRLQGMYNIGMIAI